MPITSTETPIPSSFLLVLYPGHQLLDSAGPLDILSTVTRTTGAADLTLTIASSTLDPVDLALRTPSDPWTWEHMPNLPRTETGSFSGSGFNPRFVPDITFAQALTDLRETGGMIKVKGRTRHIDCVLVPGGIGSRMVRLNKMTGERSSNVAELVEFLGELNRGDWVRTAWLTVCTGSDVLARTGLLDGRRATTNVSAFEGVRGRNPGVKWLEKRRWVRSLPGEGDTNGKEIIKREVWTSAGISAGMDLMLWFIAEVWGGRDFAKLIAGRLEYEWREGVGDGEIDPYYA